MIQILFSFFFYTTLKNLDASFMRLMIFWYVLEHDHILRQNRGKRDFVWFRTIRRVGQYFVQEINTLYTWKKEEYLLGIIFVLWTVYFNPFNSLQKGSKSRLKFFFSIHVLLFFTVIALCKEGNRKLPVRRCVGNIVT